MTPSLKYWLSRPLLISGQTLLNPETLRLFHKHHIRSLNLVKRLLLLLLIGLGRKQREFPLENDVESIRVLVLVVHGVASEIDMSGESEVEVVKGELAEVGEKGHSSEKGVHFGLFLLVKPFNGPGIGVGVKSGKMALSDASDGCASGFSALEGDLAKAGAFGELADGGHHHAGVG